MNPIILSEKRQSRRLSELLIKINNEEHPLPMQVTLLTEVFDIIKQMPNIIRNVQEFRPVVLSMISDYRPLKEQEDELAQVLANADDDIKDIEDEDTIIFFEEAKELLESLRSIRASMDSTEEFINSL